MKHPSKYYAALADRLGMKLGTYSESAATFESPQGIVTIPGWFAASLTGVLDGPPKREFVVSVNYQTPTGQANSVRVPVTAADEDEAVDKANKIARRIRRVMKIDGGDVMEGASE